VFTDPLQMSVMMEQVCRQFPSVWHVGEADLQSKARRFHKFWRSQWKALRQSDDSAEARTWGRDLDLEDPTREDFNRAVENYISSHRTFKVWQPPPQGLQIYLRKVGAL
jgi:hypothetical protein